MKKSILLWLALLISPSLWAACSFDSGYSRSAAVINLPATLSVPRDAPNGTELWSSGWMSFSGTNISCNSSGSVAGSLATGTGPPAPGYTSNGFNSVFTTNVPGIGVSVFWCNQVSCNPDYTKVTPLPSLAWSVIATQYPLRTSWWVRLIKTGDIDTSAGPLTIGGASTISYAGLPVADLTIAGASVVGTRGCELLSAQNMDVRLPTVAKTDFSDASPTPADNGKAAAFTIRLQCDKGVKVSHQFDGTQTQSGSNVLANAAGADMAEGVGVRLYYGDVSSTTPVELAQKKFMGLTAENMPMSIPVAARYYKTVPRAADIKAGRVSTIATFTMYYE
ncbi:fimbrial protein [Pseudomonas schmalbachii]|uniref:Type 1 fimbrial protein n=1 Tax=Pseudomonas schmalbachii TaxID=2816993 RepID=A0ABS3TYC1_9PSED|nr:fimbrial protein [Pseudomonas schmalbachii]MBO3277695.1 type 1 fimbrial protein [Pseudomonas schmalbachii]